jgi:hypothetical protein
MQDMKPDITNLSVPALLDLLAAVNTRLEQLRQDHIAAGEALGLSLCENGKPRRRKPTKESDAD